MIVFVRGRLTAKTPNAVVVDCGGIGYEILTPLTVTEKLPDIGEETTLLTEFIVRQDAQLLFGFLLERERVLFRRLLKISGVGAKMALAMMSAMNMAELLTALAAEDVGRLSSIPGVGKKTAERMIVDFRGSPMLLEAAASSGMSDINSEVEQALAALGYKRAEIRRALGQLSPPTAAETLADRVRAALRVLSGRG